LLKISQETRWPYLKGIGIMKFEKFLLFLTKI